MNRIHKANIKSFKPVPLSRSTKDAIFNKHFKEDVKKLEEVLDRKMNWN